MCYCSQINVDVVLKRKKTWLAVISHEDIQRVYFVLPILIKTNMFVHEMNLMRKLHKDDTTCFNNLLVREHNNKKVCHICFQ